MVQMVKENVNNNSKYCNDIAATMRRKKIEFGSKEIFFSTDMINEKARKNNSISKFAIAKTEWKIGHSAKSILPLPQYFGDQRKLKKRKEIPKGNLCTVCNTTIWDNAAADAILL